MAKQVIWSPLAKEELKNILLSTLEKQGDKRSCKTIYDQFQNALHRVTLNPFIGKATEMENIRYVTPHPDYTIFYRHSLVRIEVLVIWNNHHKGGRMKTITAKGSELQHTDKQRL